MRRVMMLGVVLCMLLTFTPAVQAQAGQQLLQGTQLKLVLLNGLSTTVARDGDPFTAVIAEPVYVGGQLVLPAGVRVNGEVRAVTKPRRFGLLRGQAAMHLAFRSLEMDRREIPAPMSIISIHETAAQGTGKRRGDIRTEEGALVEAKRDIKGAVTTAALGGGGGSAVGAVFSHAMRGLWIGLAGSTAYVMVKKGKDVELPAQSGFLVRLDSTITLPSPAGSAPYTGGMP